MNKLLAAAFAAGLLSVPAAFAQETAPEAKPSLGPSTPDASSPPVNKAPVATTPTSSTPDGNDGAAPGAAPDSGAGGGIVPGSAASMQEGTGEAHAETPHYPLQHPEELDWTFSGPFGHWNLAQLQRGLKVYKEVCSACHSMELVAFRDLTALGYGEDQIKALAAEYTVKDPNPNSSGEIVERPAIPSDYFPSPYPNAEAAAAANNGAAPPDMSLIAKARSVERGFPQFVFDILPWMQYAEGGPDYIHSLLNGYNQAPPKDIVVQPGTYYNPHFIAGPALAMPQPISDGQVTYDDGAPETLDQYSRDISAFLMWTAEPHLVERKATGLVVMIFLVAFSVLLYLVKRRVWAGTAH